MKKKLIDANEKEQKPKLTLHFPNLLLIPFVSLVGAMLKAFNMNDWSWMSTLLFIPTAFYFAVCICWCILVIVAMMVIHLYYKRS